MARWSEHSGTRIGREMEPALSKINRWQQQAVALLTEYTPDVNQTIEMLFAPDTIARATAAVGVVPSMQTVRSYKSYTFNATLVIDFEDAYPMPIRAECIAIQEHKVAPLRQFVAEVEKVYLQYEEVKGVLRWLNRNATLGAIRAYFPSVMKLCPNMFGEMVTPPTRYDEPLGMAAGWLQHIRDAGNTVASAQMIPAEARARDRNSMWLTFEPRTVDVGESKYLTDQITFHI